MLSGSNRYLYLFHRKTILSIVSAIAFAPLVHAQNKLTATNASPNHLSPLLVSSFKKQVKPASDLNERFKSPKNELMFWPNYPLTYAQIEARNQEWERENNRSLGEQIASDIIKNYVNALIYGKKHPPANVPKF